MVNLLVWIVLGGLVGWVASVVMGTRKQQGCAMDVIVGIAGAFVGGAVMSLINGEGLQFGMALGISASSILTAVLGAVILLAGLRILR